MIGVSALFKTLTLFYNLNFWYILLNLLKLSMYPKIQYIFSKPFKQPGVKKIPSNWQQSKDNKIWLNQQKIYENICHIIIPYTWPHKNRHNVRYIVFFIPEFFNDATSNQVDKRIQPNQLIWKYLKKFKWCKKLGQFIWNANISNAYYSVAILT